MIKRFWKWIRVIPTPDGTVVESTKDYISDGNDYINDTSGWKKIEEDFVDVDIVCGEY